MLRNLPSKEHFEGTNTRIKASTNFTVCLHLWILKQIYENETFLGE